MSEKRRKYRKFTGRQKLELVTASLRGEKTIAEICREHEISETLLRRWRDQALEAAQERLDGGQERSAQAEQRRRIAELERALGRKTYEAEILGNGFRVWEVRHEALLFGWGERPCRGPSQRSWKRRAA